MIALYFSAHWCNAVCYFEESSDSGKSKMFTESLKEVYYRVTNEAKKLQVIFVSLDSTVESYNVSILLYKELTLCVGIL